ncbi:FkbM family methyltransferase [Stieleria sp. TO1_6]|uniref:FkbM family methyltransferase n=1 Tax=Stieleria tagensis TaxID=2956795 RepID=UPI00209AFE9B|nr:FkbM family methyltransferase [Stieleria tagensis]MCO8123447.1 FkbM family methyltransferase [Stieleria tagensis]
MLHLIHRALLATPLTRRLHRKSLVYIKQSLGYSDPYDDIEAVVQSTKPSAILDIGSHIGKTIHRMSEFRGHTPIHGFEPTPDSFKKLKKRFQKDRLVSVHQLALSDRTGTCIIQCNKNEQTNSLLQNGCGNNEILAEATRNVGTVEVPTMTLDQWFFESGIHGGIVIKCDVQGAEGLMLAGAEKVFSSNVYAFYSEAQIAPMYEEQIAFHELNRRLTTDFDFSLANIYPCFRDQSGRALQTDALWIRNDKF